MRKELTKRQLKQKIEKVKVAEVLSAIDIDHAKGAIDVGKEDLIDIAFIAQHKSEVAGSKFSSKLRMETIKIFFNFTDCPFLLGDKVQAIFLDDMIICKKVE
jgi:hypothetical protein